MQQQHKSILSHMRSQISAIVSSAGHPYPYPFPLNMFLSGKSKYQSDLLGNTLVLLCCFHIWMVSFVLQSLVYVYEAREFE